MIRVLFCRLNPRQNTGAAAAAAGMTSSRDADTFATMQLFVGHDLID